MGSGWVWVKWSSRLASPTADPLDWERQWLGDGCTWSLPARGRCCKGRWSIRSGVLTSTHLLPTFCPGIMLFREKSLAFVKEWIRIIEADETVWDQNAFNDLFRR